MKKNIKIQFSDFGLNEYENFILDILRENYQVEISNQPDFLFYSTSGLNHYWKFKNCVKIFYTGEFAPPDFSDCDYAMGFDEIHFSDRYLQYPYFLLHLDENISRRNYNSSAINRKFCNFIYSNSTIGEGSSIRKDFCRLLMNYKDVDCPGRCLNNMYAKELDKKLFPNWALGKLEFIKNYKFTIAFENHDVDNYITEKLVQPFMAGSIPIYRGGGKGNLLNLFNPESFINAHDYDSLESLANKVKELDSDDNAYMSMLRANPLVDDSLFKMKASSRDFILNIINKGNVPLTKDPRNLSLFHQKSIRSYIRHFDFARKIVRIIRFIINN